VARELARRGFTAVRDYEGGIQDWKAGGQPTVPAR
jgi:rhodanese-related sulfurtransferase